MKIKVRRELVLTKEILHTLRKVLLSYAYMEIPKETSLHGKKMGKQWKQCQTLFFGGSKITADGDCSHEIKRRLLLGRKVMTNLDSILKSRDITLPTKICLVKAMVFPVVMYGCESWTVKKAECQKIDAFELWCWRRLLRVLGLQGDPTSPF